MDQMKRPVIVAITVVVPLLFLSFAVHAAEKFQKLSGTHIKARLAGMEITDEAHWADVFAADGTLTSFSMGRRSTGKWRIQKDELCIDRGADNSTCYQVWLSGKNVELRREGANIPMEGVLQKQSARR
jgi:hypothetical protein